MIVISDNIWGTARINFADAYLSAASRRTLGSAVLSFDRDFDRLPGVIRVDPGSVR